MQSRLSWMMIYMFRVLFSLDEGGFEDVLGGLGKGCREHLGFCRWNMDVTNSITSWWFQPISKILVNMGIFPK